MKRMIPLMLATTCLLSAIFAHAGEVGENPENPRNNTNRAGSKTDPEPDRDFSFSNILNSKLPVPQEGPFTTPELTTLGNWVEFRNNKAWGNKKFLISQDSLSIGEKDKIVRFAVAIPLRDGKSYNHVYEGIDCDTAQARAYAFAGTEEKWAPMTRTWERIKSEGYNTYEAPLYEMFCSSRDPVPVKDMIDALGSKIASPSCPGCHSKGG